MPERDSIKYNSMKMVCSKLGLHGEALDLFAAMRRAGLGTSRFTFSSMLTVATGMGDLHLGRQVHGLVVKATSVHNVFVSNSMLDFYSKWTALWRPSLMAKGWSDVVPKFWRIFGKV